MDGLPARCLKCSHTFVVRNFIGGPGAGYVGVADVGAECERCGGEAVLGNGKFHYSENKFRVLSAPPLTLSMIERLSGIASNARAKVKEGLIGAEEILAEVADVNPELATKLRAKHTLPVFALILLLLWLVKSVELNVTVDLNDLVDQAYHLTQGSDPESHLDAPIPRLAPAPSVPIQPERHEIPPSTLAAIQTGRPNRQARRRYKAQARTRTKGPRAR